MWPRSRSLLPLTYKMEMSIPTLQGFCEDWIRSFTWTFFVNCKLSDIVVVVSILWLLYYFWQGVRATSECDWARRTLSDCRTSSCHWAQCQWKNQRSPARKCAGTEPGWSWGGAGEGRNGGVVSVEPPSKGSSSKFRQPFPLPCVPGEGPRFARWSRWAHSSCHHQECWFQHVLWHPREQSQWPSGRWGRVFEWLRERASGEWGITTGPGVIDGMIKEPSEIAPLLLPSLGRSVGISYSGSSTQCGFCMRVCVASLPHVGH